ncbi:peptidase, partial [Xanthomonas sp. Kuri4-3]
MTLSLAIAAALSGCKKPDDAPAPAAAPAESAAPKALTLDESKLPPVNQFKPGDLDPAANACTDLNQYANAKFLAANPVPGDRTSWGAFEMLDERSSAAQRQLAEQAAADKHASGVEKIVGDLWSTGMDEDKVNAQGLDPLKPELAAIDAIGDRARLVDYLRSSAAKGQNELFGFGAEADFKKSSMNMAYAIQGGLGLPDPEYYTSADNKPKLEAYQAHIAKVLELSGVAAADATAQAAQVVAFETRLAKVSKTSTQLSRDASLMYNPVTLADADKLTPNWSWSEFFKSQGLAAPETFSLAIPAFHQEVSKMIGDTDPAIWRAYLRFHAVDSASPYLSQAFVDENFAFYNKTLRGQKEIKPRWKRVLATVNGQAGEALGQLYVKVAFPADSKAKMETLVGNLRTALKARIEKLDWMSPETKAKAIAKWESFTPKIGYPEKWREWNGLSTGRDSYLGNVLAAQEFNYKWNLSKIGKPVDKTEWGMSPQTVNAYYNPLQNEIVFPAAILQPPFFDPNAPEESNYGGIGAVIGHEMTHGYDDQGSRFGADGNFIPDPGWWTQQDLAAFKGRTGKLVAQFDGYRTAAGDKVKGDLTLGENIA